MVNMCMSCTTNTSNEKRIASFSKIRYAFHLIECMWKNWMTTKNVQHDTIWNTYYNCHFSLFMLQFFLLLVSFSILLKPYECINKTTLHILKSLSLLQTCRVYNVHLFVRSNKTLCFFLFSHKLHGTCD